MYVVSSVRKWYRTFHDPRFSKNQRQKASASPTCHMWPTVISIRNTIGVYDTVHTDIGN